MSRIYGYWIGKDEIHEVPYASHEEIAEEILTTIHNISEDKIWNKGAYRWMFRLGYVRVVNDDYDDSYRVEYRKGTKLSKLQKEFIKDAKYEDIIDHRRGTLEIRDRR